MQSPKPELIWEGLVQLGDEPGTFGNAAYSGLAIEFPVTLSGATSSAASTRLVLTAAYVETFDSYPGHLITVTAYEDRGAEVLTTQRLTSPKVDPAPSEVDVTIDIDLRGRALPLFVGVRVQTDATVRPGLYDDFLIKRLSNASENFAVVAALGFRN